MLILGGAGFIGSNFTLRAVAVYDTVHVLDKLTYAGDRDNLGSAADDITFVEGDISDRGLLDELYPDVDHVVNFAAESHVDRSISDGSSFVESNVLGAFSAMDALRDHDIERFVQVSTDEVYGSIESGAFVEGDPLDPSSTYSASKAGADLLVNAYWETYGAPITVLRPTNAFGPRQHPEKLIPKFTLRALQSKPLPVYGDGSNVRQWLYVEDLCSGVMAALKRGNDRIYNLGGRTKKTNLEVTRAILDEVGAPESLIEFVEDRRGHDQRYALNDGRAHEGLGFEPTVGFDEGLAQTVEWYRERVDQFEF